jgi:hypothetical protein
MSIFLTIKDLPYRLGAMATVALASSPAFAQTATGGGKGIGAMATSFTENVDSTKNALVEGGFLAGIAIAASGLFALKQAADSGGQQVPYGKGLWRVGLGSALCSLPMIVDTTNQTSGLQTGNGKWNIGSGS